MYIIQFQLSSIQKPENHGPSTSGRCQVMNGWSYIQSYVSIREWSILLSCVIEESVSITYRDFQRDTRRTLLELILTNSSSPTYFVQVNEQYLKTRVVTRRGYKPKQLQNVVIQMKATMTSPVYFFIST